MPELGRKLTCSECGAKFYDLGKPGALCPRCGSPPAGENEAKAPTPKRRPEPVPVKEHDDEDDEDLPPFDANEEELTVPEGDDDEEEDLDDDLEEDTD